jgi:hypothetical protein
MIFAFECELDDSWEDGFRSGEHDTIWIPTSSDSYQMGKGPKHTYKCDYEGMKVVQDRIQNGFRLLGSYYSHLWD